MDLFAVRQQLNMGVSINSMPLRVTDYARVSTDHLEQKKSLQNQTEHFDEYIKTNPNWTYVQGYIDDGISGMTDFKRDNFMKMIEDAKSGKFDLIVTKEISRFSRNTLDSIKYTRELLSYGVAVLFVCDNINTALMDSELRLTIMASMAQDEIRRLSERVKFGMNRAIENGSILGNDLLYGYKKNKETGNLIIVEEQANVVRKLYNMYAIENKSLNNIAKTFNEEGIKTSLNKKWSTTTLSRMIKNPKYKGFYCANKSKIIDFMTKKVRVLSESEWVMYENHIKIPPIVDDDLWQRANERLNKRNKKFGKDYGSDKSMYLNRYPFSAKIFCAEDNEVYHRRKQLKSSDDITWACAKYLKEGKKLCDSPNIRESELYKIFDDIIDSLEIKLSEVSKILIELYKSNKNNIDISTKLEELEKSKEKIIIKKDKLLELNIEGNITNSEFAAKNNEFNNQLESIDKEISKIERSKMNFEEIKEKNEKLEKILNKKIRTTSTKDKLIELLLDKIIVSKINDNKENLELKIFFNFSKKVYTKEVVGIVKQETEKTMISNVESFINFMRKNYEFKRGYNTTGTRRYIVKYQVNSYICI